MKSREQDKIVENRSDSLKGAELGVEADIGGAEEAVYGSALYDFSSATLNELRLTLLGHKPDTVAATQRMLKVMS